MTTTAKTLVTTLWFEADDNHRVIYSTSRSNERVT